MRQILHKKSQRTLALLMFGLLVGGVLLLAIGGGADVRSQEQPAVRIGYGSTDPQNLDAGRVAALGAGVYLDWDTGTDLTAMPEIQYLRTVRVHQDLTCPLKSPNAWNRELCPYVQPHSYSAVPPVAELTALAAANPGQVWLVGNEMDRRDWPDDGQDEMLPELYATAYHEIYNALKAGDPTARIAIGGIVQATPIRLAYLTRVWDSYAVQFGAEMPVDVWNVHNFVLREVHQDYGADIPPGIPEDAPDAAVYESDWTHIDLALFDQQIRAFRQWMAARGQQHKPLIVSEYGVLYRHCTEWEWDGSQWNCLKDFSNFVIVRDFMLATFNYFLNERDCAIGFVADDCRLVQQWVWFSLDHPRAIGNPRGHLYDSSNDALTPLGEVFRDWVSANRPALAAPIPDGQPQRLHLPLLRR